MSMFCLPVIKRDLLLFSSSRMLLFLLFLSLLLLCALG